MDRALMADLMSGVQGGLVRCVLDWFFFCWVYTATPSNKLICQI